MKKENLPIKGEKKSIPSTPPQMTGTNFTSSNDYTEMKSEQPIQTNYNKEPGHEKAAKGSQVRPVSKMQPYLK